MAANSNRSTLRLLSTKHICGFPRRLSNIILLLYVLNFAFVLHCETYENEAKNSTSNDEIEHLPTEGEDLADDAKLSSRYDYVEYADDGTEESHSSEVEQAYHDHSKLETNKDSTAPKKTKDFYSFSAVGINGKSESLGVYSGKVSLVVNVASECGFTDSHYKGLVKLQHKYQDEDFVVLAFPCNQFGAQEPKSNLEIEKFVKTQYGVKFPIFAKVNVLEDNVPDVWKYLIESSGEAPNWNFWKYLVDRQGKVLGAWGPWASVDEIHGFVDEAIHGQDNTKTDDKVDVTEKKTLPRHGGEL